VFGIHQVRVYWYIDVQKVACPAANPASGTWEHVQTTYPPNQQEAIYDSAFDYLLSQFEDSTYLPAPVP
jgi:hypothetical protein